MRSPRVAGMTLGAESVQRFAAAHPVSVNGCPGRPGEGHHWLLEEHTPNKRLDEPTPALCIACGAQQTFTGGMPWDVFYPDHTL